MHAPALLRAVALIVLAVLLQPTAVAQGQTPDELLASVDNGQCRDDLPIYNRIDERAVCRTFCDGYPMTLQGGIVNSQWLKCIDHKKHCREQVDVDNEKIAKYNAFVRACNMRIRKADERRRKEQERLLPAPPAKVGAADRPDSDPDEVQRRLERAKRKSANADRSNARQLQQIQSDVQQAIIRNSDIREEERNAAAKTDAERKAATRAAEMQQTGPSIPPNCRRADFYRRCMQIESLCTRRAWFVGMPQGSPKAIEHCCYIGACLEGELPN